MGAPLASILATGLGYYRHGALVAGCLLLPYLAATLLVRSEAVRELGTGIPILNYALVVFLIVLFGRVTFPALKNTLTREILVNLQIDERLLPLARALSWAVNSQLKSQPRK